MEKVSTGEGSTRKEQKKQLSIINTQGGTPIRGMRQRDHTKKRSLEIDSMQIDINETAEVVKQPRRYLELYSMERSGAWEPTSITRT